MLSLFVCDCVVGAGGPTEEQLGGDHLLSPGTGLAQGPECSWRPGQGWPKDQSPSSGSFSHLPPPEAAPSLEAAGNQRDGGQEPEVNV